MGWVDVILAPKQSLRANLLKSEENTQAADK